MKTTNKYYFLSNDVTGVSLYGFGTSDKKVSMHISDIGITYTAESYDIEDKYIFQIYESLLEVPPYNYPSVLFAVEIDGVICRHNRISTTYAKSIKLLKIIDRNKVIKYQNKHSKEMIDSDNVNIRYNATRRGFGLQKLLYDPFAWVRTGAINNGANCSEYPIEEARSNIAVAKALINNGYFLDEFCTSEKRILRLAVARTLDISPSYFRVADKMKDDSDYYIRSTLAAKGYNPMTYMKDPDKRVRTIIASTGPEDIVKDLVYDPDEDVRAALAFRGIELDTLIKDPSPVVRSSIADSGRMLDVLINDKDDDVKDMALSTLLNIRLNEIVNKDPEEETVIENYLRESFGITIREIDEDEICD